MNIKLQIFLTLIVVIQLYLVARTIKINKLSIRYGIFWIFLLLIMELSIIFPSAIIELSKVVGFEKASNMVLLLLCFFLFFMAYSLTIKISHQQNQIKSLIQEISILKERVNKNEREK